tara:strand:- start:2891 stop:3031 length:141 start_codon:yes stop_codon:yes gene_type:complete
MKLEKQVKANGYIVIIKRRANSKQVRRINKVFNSRKEALNHAILTA